MNLFTNRNESQMQQINYGYQGGRGEGINCEIGIDRYTLLYIKEITNKNRLYSTGNSTQYSVMTYMGKESKKRVDTCICITDSLRCTAETNTTL